MNLPVPHRRAGLRLFVLSVTRKGNQLKSFCTQWSLECSRIKSFRTMDEQWVNFFLVRRGKFNVRVPHGEQTFIYKGHCRLPWSIEFSILILSLVSAYLYLFHLLQSFMNWNKNPYRESTQVNSSFCKLASSLLLTPWHPCLPHKADRSVLHTQFILIME